MILFVAMLLTWNPNPESDLLGYKLYLGSASREYSETLWLGNVNEYSIEVSDNSLTYLTLTAIDSAWNESGFGNEVYYDPITGILTPIAKLEEIKVYPNPFVDVLNVEGCKFYDVYNIRGRKVYTTKGNIWDGSQAASGIYFIVGRTGDRYIFKKIIKLPKGESHE